MKQKTRNLVLYLLQTDGGEGPPLTVYYNIKLAEIRNK